jgi:hypothetical protein
VGSDLRFDSEYFCVSAIWRWATGDVLKAIFYLAKPYMVSHFLTFLRLTAVVSLCIF